jgi:hypothetical protein
MAAFTASRIAISDLVHPANALALPRMFRLCLTIKLVPALSIIAPAGTLAFSCQTMAAPGDHYFTTSSNPENPSSA